MKGKLEIGPNGSGSLITHNGDAIYIYKKNTGAGLDQDMVEIELIDGKISGTYEGKVINVLERFKTEFTGVLHKVKDYGFLIADSKRIPDFYLRTDQVSKYETGEKLLVKLGKWGNNGKPTCKVIKSLGLVGENDAEIESILYNYGLVADFSKEVEKESEDIDWNITEDEISLRKDMRDVLTMTIDPSSAKDFDDAISLRLINGNIWEVGVHIADVTHYIKKGTELDKESLRRGNSVYLVDRVIPMMPERLSNGVCSLRPNEDKLTYSVIFNINIDSGEIVDRKINRTIINSDVRLTYEDAQKMIEGKDNGIYSYEVRVLNEISQKLRKKRESLLFNRTEVKFKLDHEYKPIDIELENNNQSHQLIEELMLLANKTVGEYLYKKKVGIYRTHDIPNQDKILELRQICSLLGFKLDNEDLKMGLNQLSIDVKDTPYENMIQILSIRCMSKAEYGVSNIGHYGLGFDHYTHFTSPIRRYSDILAHRLLDGMEVVDHQLTETCKHINNTEIIAKKAERESIKFKQVEYLLEKIGHIFMGTITGITDWGIYVELIDSKCEGLVTAKKLNGKIEKEKFKVTVNGRELFLGDSVMVKIGSVSLLKKEINFEII